MKKNKQKGFTLVEFIVVMAIIAVLVLLAFPLFKGYTERARFTQVINDIKVTENAAEQYYLKTGLWPRSYEAGSAMTKSFVETSLNPLLNKEGEEATLEDTGLYFAVDYNVLRKYMSLPERHDRFIIQNPVGEIFYVSDFVEYYSEGESSPVEMTDFIIHNPSIIVMEGETISINTSLTPSNTTEKLSFSSNNDSIATVDTNGNVNGISVGTTTVDVSNPSGTVKSVNVEVISAPIDVTDIIIENISPSVYVGQNLQLDVTILPSDADNKTLIYSSSDSNIATIDNNGLITGVAEGTVTMTVISHNGITKTINVDVSIAPVFGNSNEVYLNRSDNVFLIDDEDNLWAWGRNGFGELGLGDKLARNIPIKTSLSNVEKVSFFSHTLALQKNGDVWATGSNSRGQLGLGDDEDLYSSFTKVNLSDVKDVLTANNQSFAINNSGELYSWGENSAGNLKLGNTIHQFEPRKVNISNVSSFVGSSIDFILSDTNELLRLNSNGSSNLMLSNVKSFAAEGTTYLVIDNDNKLYSWGNNYYGTLGLGDTTNRTTPQFVMNDVKNVYIGTLSAFAVKTNGELYSWGWNTHNKLGTASGINQNKLTPTLVELENVKYVVPSYHNTFALTNDGQVFAWGKNDFGQLGLGHTNVTSVPTKVAIEDVQDLYVLNSHSSVTYAMKNNGEIWSWGYNYYGELGLGNTTNKDVPTKVNSFN